MAFLTLRLRAALILSVAVLLFLAYALPASSQFSSSLSTFIFSKSPDASENAAQYHGYHSRYSFDLPLHSAARWMTDLPSELSLTALSIPGTHDSITNIVNGHVYQCQNHALLPQLEAGIRYFDIRARLRNNELMIYHQDSFTKVSYTDVLLTMFAFLDANPGEVLIMRLKEETTPIDSDIDFVSAFNYYRLDSPLTAEGSEQHFWVPPSPGPTRIPSLGELRGKILILQNFGPDPAPYGIKWESPLLITEDLWDIPSLVALDDKWEFVQESLQAAARGSVEGNGMWYLTHLSASIGILPIEAAAGGKKGKVVGINDRVGRWVKEGNGLGLGVVIADFPGSGLVREILARNREIAGRNDRTTAPD